MICQVLLQFNRVVFRRLFGSSYDVRRSLIFPVLLMILSVKYSISSVSFYSAFLSFRAGLPEYRLSVFIFCSVARMSLSTQTSGSLVLRFWCPFMVSFAARVGYVDLSSVSVRSLFATLIAGV